MARISVLLLAVTLLFGSHLALAADGNVRTCALTKVIECTPDAGCGEWTVEDVALPHFVRIDLQGKTISSLDKDINRTSRIVTVDRRENMTVLHGTELRGWSAAIADDTGDLTISAAGEAEGFLVFGSCITP